MGPAAVVDLHGMPALLVTAGGPGTGIVGWRYGATGSSPSEGIESFEWPARVYLTWNDAGLTFRVEGPNAEVVTAVARDLRPVG